MTTSVLQNSGNVETDDRDSLLLVMKSFETKKREKGVYRDKISVLLGFMTTMSLHAQIACKPSRQTNHLSKRWGDKWRLIFVAIFSWKHRQYRRGWRRMFEETNRLQSFLTKNKLNNSSLITKGKATISEERKRRWKEADRHNAEVLIKGNERVLPSHPYSPSKNTSRTHAATGASSPPRTTSSKTK